MPDQNMGQCKLCGMTAALDKYGYCKECEKKIEESPLGRNTFQSNNTSGQPVASIQRPSGAVPIDYTERKTLDRLEHEECFLPTHKIIQAFNNFYKFFKRGSISASIVLFVGWLIYAMYGLADDAARQSTEIESYAYGASQTLPVQGFNPHWEFLLTVALILILGLFLAYFSQAIAKIIEKVAN